MIRRMMPSSGLGSVRLRSPRRLRCAEIQAGLAVPVCQITPGALAFDTVAVDQTKDLTFTIKITGSGTLTGARTPTRGTAVPPTGTAAAQPTATTTSACALRGHPHDALHSHPLTILVRLGARGPRNLGTARVRYVMSIQPCSHSPAVRSRNDASGRPPVPTSKGRADG
jgi:hypothetical protein